MNGLTLLAGLTVLAVAWALRAMWLDLARERRRTARLRAANAELRERIEHLLDDLDDSAVLLQAAARDRHPSAMPLPTNVQYGGGNLRIVRGGR